ncbi:MAG: hypothetical protein M3273_09900, partial [Actinomycetota bacterium]|nr:hypothetical protein [Actinomycetota bacterium]
MAHAAVRPESISRVLGALGRGVLGNGYEPQLLPRMVEAMEMLPTAALRTQLSATLRALDTRAGALALTGRPVPVSWLTPDEAEALIVRWKSSHLPNLRNLAGAVISLVVSTCYGTRGPQWERIGYPGPLGPPPDTPKPLHPEDVTEDLEVACDVVVVGSGAGGGCVAGQL